MVRAEELINFCHHHHIITILTSGSIEPILEVYRRKLGIDYLVGSKPTVKDKIIQGIDSSAYPKSGNFKVDGITQILNQHKIKPSESIAIGDSRGDLPMFKLAGLTIAINPKGGIEEFVDHIVSDLHQAKDIIAPLTSSQSSPLPFTSTPPN